MKYARYIVAGIVGAGLVLGAYFITPHDDRLGESIRQERKVNEYIAKHGTEQLNQFLESGMVQTKNVRGNEAPESFIELGGVSYYSHIDGNDLSDLVCE